MVSNRTHTPLKDNGNSRFAPESRVAAGSLIGIGSDQVKSDIKKSTRVTSTVITSFRDPEPPKRFQGIQATKQEGRKGDREQLAEQKLKEVRSALQNTKVKFEDYLMKQGIRKAKMA